MRKPINITLNGAALTPLRHACLSRLERDNDRLGDVLPHVDRERRRDVWAAFTRLECVGSMLHRIGWTEQDTRERIKLTSHPEVALAIDMLRDEAATESATRADALECDAPDEAARATTRELAIHNLLNNLEAALNAATVSRATTFSAAPPAA
jgi:hypothetical protein